MAIQDPRTLKFLKYLVSIGSPLAVQVRKYINRVDNNSIYALPEWNEWVATAYPPKPVSDIDPFTGKKTQVAKTRDANERANQPIAGPPWVANQPPKQQVNQPIAGPPWIPTPSNPLDPDFLEWLRTQYKANPQFVASLQAVGMDDPQLKPYLDYYNNNVKGKTKPGEEISFTSDYGGRVLLGSDGKYYRPDDRTVRMSDAEVYQAWNAFNNEVNPKQGAPTKLDPGFRAWLVKEYGEDVAAHYDQTDYRDTGLTDLRKFYNTYINPVSDPNAMTPYQQGSLALQREQWEATKYAQQVEQERQQAEARNKEWQAEYNLQTEASQSAIEKQRNEIELIKGRLFPFPYEQGNRQAYQDMQRTAFENARQSILGSLSSPADWIKRWEVENARNPYTVQQPSPLESSQSDVSNTEARINMFNQMADAAEKLVNELSANQDYGAGTPNEATVLTQARNDVTNYRNAAEAEKGRLSSFQSNVTYLQGQPQPAPSGPVSRGNAPAPSWLPAFAPGQRAGQSITRENVATPSAQQWAGTPWSVQQGLSGYLDWAGYRPMADILSNMAQMLPNAPGGGARWSPYIGR